MAGCWAYPNGGCRVYKDGSCRCSEPLPKKKRRVRSKRKKK